MMRTHTCGELRRQHAGQTVTLCGWADTVRDHGGLIFIDLRDRYGVTQVTFDPRDSQSAWDAAQSARGEYVLRVTGVVQPRPADMVNPRLATGEIEVRGTAIELLNRSQPPPFPLEEAKAVRVAEELRLTYRYLDLRRESMQRNLVLRHRITQAIRRYLDGKGFIEIETPILTKSTPEGARDYLVPSRVNPGCFYALPQSPQQYKQLCMVAGLDRYFQIARCFRDEDLRADRQPEFTQVDIEMSFITPEDIYALIDGLIADAMEAAGHPRPSLPLPRMTYSEAMNRYGSDKPDTRFQMLLTDLSDIFAGTQFKVFASVLAQGGVVKAINAKGLGAVSQGTIDNWTQVAKESGLGGLAYIRVQPDGSWKSPIVKFFSEAEQALLRDRLDMRPGDLVLFAADKPDIANIALGRIRLLAGAEAGAIPTGVFRFTWVTDFPLFERSAEGGITSVNHPFTAPHPDDAALIETDPLRARALAYDIILNGIELGGGSIRIHDSDLQARAFRALGLPEEKIRMMFGHMIDAFKYGAPPHGGIALGLDRFVMLMAGADSIRDVIAFPKTQKAVDLMMNAPDRVEARQLREVWIQLDLPEEESDSPRK
ncbi:MAG: aspartate--tRNA ligase [Kiritimatiellae bacterium]|nr:aspartate--tRNA ligase [Kiritimatiellia bacterium]MDW8457481.1 aspartate--tRNA ligase [Verrucomicrobiota bacterium]